eukprot:1640019-Rhodomonas_salina.2
MESVTVPAYPMSASTVHTPCRYRSYPMPVPFIPYAGTFNGLRQYRTGVGAYVIALLLAHDPVQLPLGVRYNWPRHIQSQDRKMQRKSLTNALSQQTGTAHTSHSDAVMPYLRPAHHCGNAVSIPYHIAR